MDHELLKQAGRVLERWPRTMVLTHERPDGDGLGALAALKRVIGLSGRQATAFVYDTLPARYVFLGESGVFERWQDQDPATIDARYDGIVILDTCSWSQLEPVANYLRASSRPRIVIDHHTTHDELTGDQAEALYLIDPTAASVCGLIARWTKAMNWPVDTVAGEALFTGMATDTGWFRFPNTDRETLQAASVLIESGIRPEVLYARLYESWSPARLRLKAHVLATLQLHAQDAVGVMSLTHEMLERAQASSTDSEELVNELMSIGSVVVAILLSDLDDGLVRVNFRSRSPAVCGRDVDVAALAQSFGGGGHRRAAGARIAGNLAQVRQQVIEAAIAALKAAPQQGR